MRFLLKMFKCEIEYKGPKKSVNIVSRLLFVYSFIIVDLE